jgi:predicted nucleotidyltransferase
MTEQVDRIGRVVGVLERERVPYAIIGGHAVSYHHRLRVTVDVDFLVASRAMGRLEKAIAKAGFTTRRRKDVLRAWEAGADIEKDEPVVDFVAAGLQAAQKEALRTAIEVSYQGIHVRVVTRAALVALKFLSAMSRSRAASDRAQDVADLGHVVSGSWTSVDAAEARRLVELYRQGAGAELDRLIDDILNDRRILI